MSTPAEQAKDKFKNRRRMAKQGWVFILLVGTIMLITGIASDAGADRIGKIWPAIAAIIGVPGGVVLAYYGAAAYENGTK
jgi:hypothetical protein